MKGAAAGSSSWSAESGEGSARGSSNGCEWEGEGDRGREGEREAELMEGSWEESGSTTAPGHGLIRRLDYLEQTSYSTLYLTLYFKLYSVVQSTVQNNTLHGRLRSLLEMALGYQHLYGLLGGLLGCAFLFCSPFFFFYFSTFSTLQQWSSYSYGIAAVPRLSDSKGWLATPYHFNNHGYYSK